MLRKYILWEDTLETFPSVTQFWYESELWYSTFVQIDAGEHLPHQYWMVGMQQQGQARMVATHYQLDGIQRNRTLHNCSIEGCQKVQFQDVQMWICVCPNVELGVYIWAREGSWDLYLVNSEAAIWELVSIFFIGIVFTLSSSGDA